MKKIINFHHIPSDKGEETKEGGRREGMEEGGKFLFTVYICICLDSFQASLVAQMVKNRPVIQEIQVQSLGREDPLEKRLATHSSILAWRISWTEEPCRLQSMEFQRAGHDWVSNTLTWTNFRPFWLCTVHHIHQYPDLTASSFMYCYLLYINGKQEQRRPSVTSQVHRGNQAPPRLGWGSGGSCRVGVCWAGSG